MLVDRCFHALDTRRLRFRDLERRCPIASADAASVETLVGLCLVAQPELVVGAVIILGTVVVAVAIAQALAEYEQTGRAHPKKTEPRDAAKPETDTQPVTQQPVATQEPEPEGSPAGADWPPLGPPISTDTRGPRPECTPIRVPPRGGNALHNMCADHVPFNTFRGFNVVVNGKAFDALQWATRTLWEVKITAIETYSPYVQQVELRKQVAEAEREQALAAACGYQFVMGVRTQAHKAMLERAAPHLTVVLMPWC